MRTVAIILAAVAVFGTCTAVAETKADDIVGTYLTQGKDCKIEIYKEGDKYNGKITWIKDPNYGPDDKEAGKPQRDRNNPEEARRNDPMVGLNLLKNFTFDGTSNWAGGTIYDPTKGSTYKCTMKFSDPKTLDVRGYIGVPSFGRSETWTRVEQKADTPASATGTNSDPAAADAKKDSKPEEKKN